jgi:hypothetical protein
MANYHVKMTNSPKELMKMEKITKSPNQKVSINVSKNFLAQMKRISGVVGKATPSKIVSEYIKATLNQF